MRLRNKILSVLLVLILTVLTYAAIATANFDSTGNIEKNKMKTIEVSGTGTVSIAPDEAIVVIGVQTRSADALVTQKDNAAKTEKVVNALIAANIAKDNIETSSYTMYPVRDEKGENITGYVVSNELKVTIKDINRTGDVIDRAVEAGANEVNSIRFTISDESQQKVREQALNNAVKAARLDADRLASELGVTITGPIQVSTSGGTITTPISFDIKSATTPILPGSVTVSAFVSVTYEFE